ncbi:CvpA family protein [Lactobacillus sp. 0.1XD8-4]|uniref:CvpA family protein n=1 Tax=Limosilactobacillus walteri TaxID=2268022 RepID=A0ABR8P6V5_9LACO|nr:CvpA family protein [Limosilactobacillus walteri]MBD5806422.1 CvpA family protein [Limosilactobacillus walteri]MRN07479.1 CvpA family protein [Lactobacillus sp. 0.1XD8-4]
MILTTFIILILIGCFVNGHRRGLLTMVLMLGTYIIAWLVARQGTQLVGSWLKSLLPSIGDEATFSANLLADVNSNLFFYNGIAFMIIFTIVSILCHWGIRQLNWIKKIPVIGTVDKLAGGVISFLIGYLIIFVVLIVMQLWPAGWWQMQMATSELAQLIINQTPGLAHLMIDTLIQGG